MIQQFIDFVEEEKLLDTSSRILLAVSGGIDSVALGYLFGETDWEFAVAHCNFQLRGVGSDEDELFVIALAKEWGVPAYSTRFDTRAYAQEKEESIQLAARNLRYEWLEKIRQENSYTHIATAHHLSDSIETLIYNLTKGCGIRGLHGIPLQNGCIIRPLLFAQRREIEAFQKRKGFAYREDTSNQELKYRRNKIRHQVVPALKEINPSFEQTMGENINRFRQLEHLLDWAMRHIAQKAILSYGSPFRLDIKALESFGSVLPTVLFELLHPYGFNSSQVRQLANSLEHTGALFMAPTYRLLVERDELVVEKLPELESAAEFILEAGEQLLKVPGGQLSLVRTEGYPQSLNNGPWEAVLDAESLQFPLRLRHWERGDAFQPLGMNGRHQKLQDFFSNNKLSRFEKERIWILEDARGRICWLIGLRIDERFKVKPSTRAFWTLKFTKV